MLINKKLVIIFLNKLYQSKLYSFSIMYDINVDMYLNDEYTKIDSNVDNPIFACKGVYHPLKLSIITLIIRPKATYTA